MKTIALAAIETPRFSEIVYIKELRKEVEDRSADIVEMREKYREKIEAEEAEKKRPMLVIVGKEEEED